MKSNNLTFSSKIDSGVEDGLFDLLLKHLQNTDYEKVYVKNVALAPNEILFFSEVDDKDSLIRVQI